MKKFILLILVCMLSSCSIAIMRNTRHTEFFTNARVFQVLDSNDALIWDDNFNVAKIITSEEIYYEGLKISGRFILVDTYQDIFKEIEGVKNGSKKRNRRVKNS